MNKMVQLELPLEVEVKDMEKIAMIFHYELGFYDGWEEAREGARKLYMDYFILICNDMKRYCLLNGLKRECRVIPYKSLGKYSNRRRWDLGWKWNADGSVSDRWKLRHRRER